MEFSQGRYHHPRPQVSPTNKISLAPGCILKEYSLGFWGGFEVNVSKRQDHGSLLLASMTGRLELASFKMGKTASGIDLEWGGQKFS